MKQLNHQQVHRRDSHRKKAGGVPRGAKHGLAPKDNALKAMWDGLPDGTVYRLIQSQDGRTYFEYVSAGFESLFELPQRIILKDATSLYGRLHPRDRDEAMNAQKYAGETITPFQHECRFCLPSGRTRWIRWHSMPERLPDGGIAWNGVAIDITKRKAAEEAVRLSQAQLLANLDNTPNVAVQWYDERGRILYWNPASERLYGWRSADAIGKTLDALILTREDAARFLRTLHNIRKTGQPHGPYEAQVHHRDGTPGWVLATTFSMPMPEGRTGFVCMDVDITKRKLLEESLSSERNLYKDLVATTPVGVYRILVKAAREWVNNQWIARLGTHYQIVSANNEFCRILGITQAQRKADATIVAERIHPDDRADFASRNVRALHTLETFRWEGRLLRHGKVRWVQFTSVPRLLPNGDLNWTGMLNDLTERKKMEQQLKALNEGLEAKVRERTARLRDLAAELTQAEHRERRRIADVLHEDLQQRLVAMQYRVHQLLERHVDAATVHEARWLLQELQQSVDISRSLTSQLRPPVLYELGLRAALEWLAGDMLVRLGLRVDIRGETSFQLSSDDARVFAFDAVRELLMNVVKHSGAKSATVGIAWQKKNWIAIAVTDNGKGFVVTPQNQSRTFGLFSIRERIEAFGGRFEVTSRPGRGSRAVLVLPATRGARAGRIIVPESTRETELRRSGGIDPTRHDRV